MQSGFPLMNPVGRRSQANVLRAQKLRSAMGKSTSHRDSDVESRISASTTASEFSAGGDRRSSYAGSDIEPCEASVSLKAHKTVLYPKGHGPVDLKQVFAVRYDAKMEKVAVGYADGAVRIFSSDTWTKSGLFPADFDTPDPEEQKLLERGIQISRPFMANPRDPITSLSWLDTNKLLLLSGPQIDIADIGSRENLSTTSLQHNHGAMYVSDVAKNSMGECTKFIVGGTERKAVLYDATTAKEVCCIKKRLYCADSFCHSNRISAVKFWPGSDGQVYVTGSWDNSVAIWDCRSGQRERALDGDISLVGSGPEALDVDVSSIVTASYRTKSPVELFDISTGKIMETVSTLPNEQIPYTCRFSDDSRHILVGGKFVNSEKQGGFVLLSRKPGSQLVYEDHSFSSACWSCDGSVGGSQFAIGHADGSMSVWKAM